ncbi:MAG: uncharacterized protein KVP18_002956 [Porospora cf. gigantea A]|uniref:uncharacterized protein n=1 Tax=Porospora cf. gigantea A TaxID=2853593 RepID=UPI00355979C2|nr:MAG: hypothetical protein KVP18_002956 [Porospora cf. gigantea A]
MEPQQNRADVGSPLRVTPAPSGRTSQVFVLILATTCWLAGIQFLNSGWLWTWHLVDDTSDGRHARMMDLWSSVAGGALLLEGASYFAALATRGVVVASGRVDVIRSSLFRARVPLVLSPHLGRWTLVLVLLSVVFAVSSVPTVSIEADKFVCRFLWMPLASAVDCCIEAVSVSIHPFLLASAVTVLKLGLLNPPPLKSLVGNSDLALMALFHVAVLSPLNVGPMTDRLRSMFQSLAVWRWRIPFTTEERLLVLVWALSFAIRWCRWGTGNRKSRTHRQFTEACPQLDLGTMWRSNVTRYFVLEAPKGNGGQQGQYPLTLLRDRDGDIAHEFYESHEHRWLQVPTHELEAVDCF